MYAFFVSLHARPAQTAVGPVVKLGGVEYPTLVFKHEALAQTTLGISFEEAATALGKLPRMYCEPDGSFVWVSAHDEATWQVDGNLFDRAGQLLLVDLKGSCPAPAFDQLLDSLHRPGVPVMLQLVREAVFLDEQTFRALAIEN